MTKFLNGTGLDRLIQLIKKALSYKQDTITAGEGINLTNDNVLKTTGIPFGIVDNTSTATAYTVTVPGIYKLEDGVCCLVKNGVVTSAAGFTLNVNGLGAKPSYNNMAAATQDTTIFNANYTMLFIYDSTRVSGGCWICYRGYNSDNNTIAYQLRHNSSTLPTTAKFYRYRLLFTSADGTHYVPANTSTSTNATSSRTVNQTPIDPFGDILYYGSTSAVNSGANPSASVLWQQYVLTLGYSFNRTGAALVLQYPKPLYIKCAPQSTGSAIIDADNPYVQTLPSTDDGKIYIFLGIAYSATQVEMLNNHPVYYHDGSGIKLWAGKDSYSKAETDAQMTLKSDKPIELSPFLLGDDLSPRFPTDEEDARVLTAEEQLMWQTILDGVTNKTDFTFLGYEAQFTDYFGWDTSWIHSWQFYMNLGSSSDPTVNIISIKHKQENSTTLFWVPDTQSIHLQTKLTFDSTPTASSNNPVTSGGIKTALDEKQDVLVSGTNIKTINNNSLVGSGNITIDSDSITMADADPNDGIWGSGDTIQEAMEGITDGILTVYNEAKTFVVTISKNNSTYTANKTYTEILLAYEGGKNVVAKYGSDVLNVSEKYSDSIRFSTSSAEEGLLRCFEVKSNNTWELYQFEAQDHLTFDSTPTTNSYNPVTSGGIKTALDGKQDTLVSGTNIKTVNNNSLLGSGNISLLPGDTHIPSDLKSGTIVGKMYRNNVGGTGNFSISGNYGIIPNLTPGTYTVAIYAKSATQSYTYRFNFGSTSYDLSTTNGEIMDVRTVTVSSNSTFSGSVINSGGVASGSILSITMYSTTFKVETVGVAAITNDYYDLSNRPTIPAAANNGTLTIQQDGTTKGTFTANQSSNSTINIDLSGKQDVVVVDVTYNMTTRQYTTSMTFADALTAWNANKDIILNAGLSNGTNTIEYGRFQVIGKSNWQSVSALMFNNQATPTLYALSVNPSYNKLLTMILWTANGIELKEELLYCIENASSSSDGGIKIKNNDGNSNFGIDSYGKAYWTDSGGVSDRDTTDTNTIATLGDLANVAPMTEITYANLVTAKTNGTLKPGTWYRITDYVTTTTQTSTQSANHPFDIIVLALSNNTLSEEAKAIQHSGDSYFANSRLKAWKLQYSLENNKTLYNWADTTNGKGVIYRMIDEFGNDCPYDFKNIQFKRPLDNSGYYSTSGTDTWVYTFNAYIAGTHYDNSLGFNLSNIGSSGIVALCHDNVIKPCSDSDNYANIIAGTAGEFILNDTVFLNVCGNISNPVWLILLIVERNIFEINSRDNTLRSGISNFFGTNFESNVLYGPSYNIFGHNCKNCVLADVKNSTIGNNVHHIDVGKNLVDGWAENITIENGVNYVTLQGNGTYLCMKDITLSQGLAQKVITVSPYADTYATLPTVYRPSYSQTVYI